MMGGVSLDLTEVFRRKVWELARERGLGENEVEVVSARPLTPQEALGDPGRRDFPLLKGKEVMMQASFRGSLGQAFTSAPGDFRGSVREALERSLLTDFDRALVVATANALLRDQGLVAGTVHCRDQGPQKCAGLLLDYLRTRFGSPRVAVIGLQPALVAALVGKLQVRVTDLDPDNVGQERVGVVVESAERTAEVIEWADVVLATGTVLANGTIGQVLSPKPTVFYGVTMAGAAVLFGYERYCPCSL